MTTKATRDVLDLSIRPVNSVDINGGTVDDTAIGVAVPNEGHFTNLFANNLTVANTLDLSTATVIGTIHAYYADIAEYYESDFPYVPGTVVMIGGDKEITKAKFADDVFGVISSNPSMVMNQDHTEGHLAVALLGRVPVRVTGPVSKGQKIVLRNQPGVARAWMPNDRSASVIGRSLVTELGSVEVRLVEVAIGTIK